MTKPLHRTAIAIGAIYLVAVVLILFWPTPVDRPASGGLQQFIKWMHVHGMPKRIGYSQIEFSANIVLFIPMGYIASAWSKNCWVGLVLGAMTSCFVELSQGLFLQDRFASGLDVLANTMGAGIGCAVFFLHQRHQASLQPSAVHEVNPP